LNSTISACRQHGQWVLALALLVSLPNRTLLPNATACNAVISACERAAQWERALLVLSASSRALVGPDIIGLSAAISACGRGGAWMLATHLLHQMRQLGIVPNVVSFGALMSAFSCARHWANAMCLLDDMAKLNVNPSLVCCNSAISACEVSGAWLVAIDLLAGMSRQLVQPDVAAFNATMSACEKSAQWEQACRVLGLMQSSLTGPDRITFGAMMSACGRAFEWKRAMMLLNDAEISQASFEGFSAVGLFAAAAACEEAGRADRAVPMLTVLQKQALVAPVLLSSASPGPAFVAGAEAEAPMSCYGFASAYAPDVLHAQLASKALQRLSVAACKASHGDVRNAGLELLPTCAPPVVRALLQHFNNVEDEEPRHSGTSEVAPGSPLWPQAARGELCCRLHAAARGTVLSVAQQADLAVWVTWSLSSNSDGSSSGGVSSSRYA